MLGERFLDGFEKWLGEVQPHHTVHGSTGTGRITADEPARRASSATRTPGVYAHPAVVTGVRPDDALYRNETFGPLVSVMRFSTFDEAVELANGHGYGLSAAIYTRDAQAAFRFRERVSRRDAVGQQLDLRRRGPPAVRRQRQERQRLPPVAACGCSTSSPAGSR